MLFPTPRSRRGCQPFKAPFSKTKTLRIGWHLLWANTDDEDNSRLRPRMERNVRVVSVYRRDAVVLPY
jgi:hypothetical protein